MRFGVIAAAAVGFAVAIYLILRVGLHPVLHAVEGVGFDGFAIIVAFALALELVLGAGWYSLIPNAASYWTFVIGRQIRDSASDVLPFSQIAGIVVGARAAVLRGLKPPLAF